MNSTIKNSIIVPQVCEYKIDTNQSSSTFRIDTFVSDYIDTETFERDVIGAYGGGTAERELPADVGVAVSWVPAVTVRLRDFSTIATDRFQGLNIVCLGTADCYAPGEALVSFTMALYLDHELHHKGSVR